MAGPDEDTEPPKSGEPMARAFELTVPAYRELVERMVAHVHRIGLGAHVHGIDVVHDAFVTALGKPIEEQPSTHEWEEFVAWMCKLAQYAALSNLKPKRRRTYVSLAPLGDLDERIAGTRDDEHDAAVRMAYHALPAEMRDIVGAHAVEGKTIREIAAETKLAPTTVFHRYSRGIGLLHTRLEFVEEAPSRAIGRSAIALPFLLLVLAARVARAAISSAFGQLRTSLARSPMRVMGSVAVGAAIGMWPSGGTPQAMPGTITASQATRADVVRRDEPRSIATIQGSDARTEDATRHGSPRRLPLAPPQRDHAKPFDWMAANATRRGEASVTGAK
ncbi:RNA polymerase sigma factor [Polyangium jinanense]|uniref:Sigma-70 family RNA polymerase sigma factor n=1 Tax=Polyangium jinanense TaxID=2829994 RepID=A0A9X3X8K4_9BACT|nr:sigma-70 family RNA polymerase sigma factor [Polyangium jinanense]MDC3956697.1 sigma-70 family RNA polymerase sigma factor [Polyangium jinanense]MDC3984760.1 sigma-70 family RNA polymerase sigma factor [Polyangium jinanense]